MRPIDADALDAKFYNETPISVFGTVKRMAKMREIIESMPTITQEPRRGKWIEQESCDENIMAAKCSNCNHYAYQAIGWGGGFDLNFCPNCGADMMEEQRDEKSM